MTEDDGICCVCHHPLANHIDEGKWWRCHSLGADFYQCECRLQEYGDKDYYDLGKRIKEQLEDLKNGRN